MKLGDDLLVDHFAKLRREEEEKVVQTTSLQLGLPYINLHGYTINPEAVSLIPEIVAREANVVAFDITRSSVLVAVKNPNDPRTLAALQSIEQACRLKTAPHLCSRDSLEHGWKRYADQVTANAKTRGVFEIDASSIKNFIDSIHGIKDVGKLMDQISNTNNARRITEILELAFAGALALQASDIHIEPEEKVARLRYRLDGLLYDIYDIDRLIYTRAMSRLKLLSGMTLNHRQEAQDGRFTFTAHDRDVEIRSSVIPGANGESIVMRILDPSVATYSIDNIDLNPTLLTTIKRLLAQPSGLIITTGPTGSGKTTALYAFLRAVHQEDVKIITIENPVEYKIEGIVQTQTDDNYTFASGLRAILRQDPDVIMVGEIRDREVAETAIHAAQTGHLVFSTLHTNSAVGGFPRLIDLGIDPRSLGNSISILLGQRLVRRLCQKCRTPYQADAEESTLINHIMQTHPHPTLIPNPLTLYKPGGCALCGNTGYKGRIGIFEAVLMDQAVEDIIIRDPREHLIRAAAKPQGIPSMVEDGIDRLIQGVTSLTELRRVVTLPIPGTENHETLIGTDSYPDDDSFMAHIVN